MKPEEIAEMFESLPSSTQDAMLRRVINEVGGEKVAAMLLTAVMNNEPVYRETVDDLRTKLRNGNELATNTKNLVDDLRSKGRDFTECWAAVVTITSAVAEMNTLLEICGYALARLAWDGEVPTGDKSETTDSAEEQVIDLGKLAVEIRVDES